MYSDQMACLEVKERFSHIVILKEQCVSHGADPPAGEGGSCYTGKDQRGRSWEEEEEGKVRGERDGMSEEKYCVWLSHSLRD